MLLGSVMAGSGYADPALPGGHTTVRNITSQSFAQPVANMPEQRLSDFFVGNSFFKNNWVQSPASASARDGLGPHYIARSCSGCHLSDGRGQPPLGRDLPTALLLKTRAWLDEQILPHPDFGEQLTTLSIDQRSPEAGISITYQALAGEFADGQGYVLQQPSYQLELLMPASQPIIISPRVAPQMIGLGLLEAIPADQLRAWADPDDADGDGISGRSQQVTDQVNGGLSIGRFGWKTDAPGVLQQTAGALNNDIGITSAFFPVTDRDNQDNESQPEISAALLAQLAYYSMTLAVPAARIQDKTRFEAGKRLFQAAGCAACHVSTVTTGQLAGLPELSGQTIHAYTDLLLHDMGEGLADHYYPQPPASEAPAVTRFRQEWRTPPLWGLGLLKTVSGHTRLLHDGRARNISEAILWHAGEADEAQQNYRRMSRAERQLLLEFLNAI